MLRIDSDRLRGGRSCRGHSAADSRRLRSGLRKAASGYPKAEEAVRRLQTDCGLKSGLRMPFQAADVVVFERLFGPGASHLRSAWVDEPRYWRSDWYPFLQQRAIGHPAVPVNRTLVRIHVAEFPGLPARRSCDSCADSR